MSKTTQYRKARKFAHLTSGTTTILRPTGQSLWLHRVVINSDEVGTVTVYNNGAASGEIVASMTVTSGLTLPYVLDYGVRLDNGCTIVLSINLDVTVIYE